MTLSIGYYFRTYRNRAYELGAEFRRGRTDCGKLHGSTAIIDGVCEQGHRHLGADATLRYIRCPGVHDRNGAARNRTWDVLFAEGVLSGGDER